MCMYVCVYLGVHGYVCNVQCAGVCFACVSVYMNVYVCVYLGVHGYVCVCMHSSLSLTLSLSLHMCTCMSINMCVCMYSYVLHLYPDPFIRFRPRNRRFRLMFAVDPMRQAIRRPTRELTLRFRLDRTAQTQQLFRSKTASFHMSVLFYLLSISVLFHVSVFNLVSLNVILYLRYCSCLITIHILFMFTCIKYIMNNSRGLYC